MGFCFFNNAAIAARAAQVWPPLLHAPVTVDNLYMQSDTQLVQDAVRHACD